MENLKESPSDVTGASLHPIVHTRGPWRVSKSGKSVVAGGIKIHQSTGPCAASVAVQNAIERELQANARIIACIPELLVALRDSLALNINWSETAEDEHLQHLSEYKRVIEQGKNVIKAATGEVV